MAYNQDEKLVQGLVRVSTLVGAFVLLFLAMSSWVTIPQGTVGVVFDKFHGGVLPDTLKEGWHFKMPLVQKVTEYPVALRTYSTIGIGEGEHPNDPGLVTLPTMGGQHIDQQMSLTYFVQPDKAGFVFDKFKGRDIEDIESDFIRRQIQSVATAVTGSYDLMAVLGPSKAEIQGKIQAGAKAALAPYGFEVVQVNLGYAKPPASIEAALQAKMQAEQNADAAKYALQKAEMDAKSQIAKAEGEAKANQLVRQQLSPEFLQFRSLEVRQQAIQKWDGKLPTQFVPGSAIPFLNLNEK